MARIEPFAALRPRPDLAAKICELPYDVMSSKEARGVAEGNPLSFLHVSKPEIDLDPEIDPYRPEVYARGRENFSRFISTGYLRPDPALQFYLYRQAFDKHSQTGIVGCVRCEDYLNGSIKKHELTRPDKEADRVRHIEALNAQTGPAFLTYRATAAIDEIVRQKTIETPEVDFVARDGVRHSAWSVGDSVLMQRVAAAFESVPCFYIADGHHRSAAAVRVWDQRNRTASAAGFLAVVFPHNQLKILPYHRVLKDLNGQTPQSLVESLGKRFQIKESKSPQSNRPREVGLYLEGCWRTLVLPAPVATAKPSEKLDVALLQTLVLDPIFGVADPRTSKRINFVGGIRGTPELERLVDAGEYACAFSLFPTSIEDLMVIADANELMPPKSTWFEPKLRDAMFSHLL